jgi:hypothetical protein
MNITQIQDEISYLSTLPNLTYDEGILLKKLRSAERFTLYVLPHLTSINGYDITHEVIEANDDESSEQLDRNGIDGLFTFKHVGISVAYASRTWTRTDETPLCGGVLVRFCRDRGTTEHEMQHRLLRHAAPNDEAFVQAEREAQRWYNPKPVRFQEEAIKLLTGEMLGLQGIFTADFFVSSYFRPDDEALGCERFSIVPMTELRRALHLIYSQTIVGNGTLLDLAGCMVREWRAPYLLEESEFNKIESALAQDNRIALLRIGQGRGRARGFVRFLYLRREFLEAVCPNFQMWENGFPQNRLNRGAMLYQY